MVAYAMVDQRLLCSSVSFGYVLCFPQGLCYSTRKEATFEPLVGELAAPAFEMTMVTVRVGKLGDNSKMLPGRGRGPAVHGGYLQLGALQAS